MTREELARMALDSRWARIECAARVMVHVQDTMPGDDLGAEAKAVAWLELRAALKAMDEYGQQFDAAAALSKLMRARGW